MPSIKLRLAYLLVAATLAVFPQQRLAAASQSVLTLSFPREQSSGKVYFVKILPYGLIEQPTAKTIAYNAQGDVKVPANQDLLLQLSYFGVEHASCLDAMGNAKIVQVDMQNLDNGGNDLLFHLRKFNFLQSLKVTDTDITDDGLKNLQGLTQLVELHIAGTLVKGSGFTYLAHNPIEVIKMGELNLDESKLALLKPFTRLRYLSIQKDQLTDQGLEYVGQLRAMQILDISKNKVTDAGLSHLAGLPLLHRLDISDTRVTIRSIPTLQSLPSLDELGVRINQFSTKDLLALKKALPKCQISVHNMSKLDPELFTPLH